MCNKQRQKVGFDKFFVGNYPTKGCFSRGGKAYFGIGGNKDDKSESPLSGNKERLWCNESPSQPNTKKPTEAPTEKPRSAPQLQSTCLTQSECNLKRHELGFTKYMIGNYSTKGCFSEGDTAFFGSSGTTGDKSESPLSGEKKRIWCATAPKCIDVQVNTGELFGDKVGFKLSTKPRDGSTSEELFDFPVGSLESESEYAKQVCVSEGTYTLTVVGKSSYSARVVGEEVLFGFNAWGKTNSHDIIVGYKPAMDDDEKAWLDEHNTRRETFHTKHNKEYRPLQWSSELAQDASNWVDKILPTCEIVQEPNLEEGESIAINEYSDSIGPSENETPAKILARWSDKKLDREYPDNQTMTQVMWRATRYVGCATKFVKYDDGTYCYVSICRYTRPGNCNTGSGNWLATTLDDRTRCGKACPEEGCH